MPVVLILLLAVLLIALIVFGPILVIWSLNTLFGFTIAYTFKTWFATWILAGTVGGTKYHSCNKS
jgi:hypothetical protein